MPGKIEKSSNQVQLRALHHEGAFVVCLAVSAPQKPLDDVGLFLLMVSGGGTEQIGTFESVHGIVDVQQAGMEGEQQLGILTAALPKPLERRPSYFPRVSIKIITLIKFQYYKGYDLPLLEETL